MNTQDPQFMAAFVDGELTGEDLELALGRLDTDPEFKRDVCELRTLKGMLQNAYVLPRDEAVSWSGRRLAGWSQALAASLLLAIGVGGGWLLRGQVEAASAQPVLAGAGQPISTLVGQMEAPRILLHLDSNDPVRIQAALDSAERLAMRNEKARIDILLNSDGLNLVRAETSVNRDQINRLMEEYPNIRFVACGQTMARFRDQGKNVTLLPDVLQVGSALDELSHRVQHGWVYVHA